ncbi:hypothetical protein M422DRAFT_248702 [Sphaerobolus stellatus SS14]|nr:hypothetical protein M422DRAFT_248702 [Sphaerobolus stellatus SS14]
MNPFGGECSNGQMLQLRKQPRHGLRSEVVQHGEMAGVWLMAHLSLSQLVQAILVHEHLLRGSRQLILFLLKIINTPDLRIIDYGVGLPGSQHDATAWKQTRIPQEHGVLLEKGEWVWADTAYPLQPWCQAPYKRPEKDTRENTHYNYHVSRIRVRSEHCMGFLKGRWSSLRGLRLRLDKEEDIQLACICITACITLHSFAMQHESGQDIETDVFFQEGLALVERERHEEAERHALDEIEREVVSDVGLQAGKEWRQKLKEHLQVFQAH